MKNNDLIKTLIDKSSNAFGELIGLTEEAKLKVSLTIIQDTIKTAFKIDSNFLTSTILTDILIKKRLSFDQTRLLTSLLWSQAEILLKLNQPIKSLENYENVLQLLQWQTQQDIMKIHLEKQNRITELKAVIETLKSLAKTKNILGERALRD